MKKETHWRRSIKTIYNKERRDFETDEAYDDYLEEIEDKIFIL